MQRSDYHDIFIYVTAVLSLFFNGFLLLAIKFSSSSYIGKYRYLSVLLCIFNIIYSIIQCWLMLIIDIFDNSFIVISSLTYLPIMAGRLLSALFAACFAQSLCLFALHFIYRYVFTVKTQYRWIFDSKKTIVYMVLFNCFVVVDYFFVCFYNFGKSNIKDQHWKILISKGYPRMNLTALGYISAFLKSADGYQTSDLIGLLNVSIVIGSTFAVLPFCAISIYKKLGAVEVLSDRLKEQQMKLFKVLLLQTVLALTFTFVPSSAIIIGTALFQQPDLGEVVVLLLTLCSVLDPLILLYFVGCYRSAVKQALHLRFPGKEVSTSAPQMNTTARNAKNIIHVRRASRSTPK